MLGKYPILSKVNEIANAYKHCRRRDRKKLHAKDVKFDHQTLFEAYRFWLDYHQEGGRIDFLKESRAL